jgi:hypothetical protein
VETICFWKVFTEEIPFGLNEALQSFQGKITTSGRKQNIEKPRAKR